MRLTRYLPFHFLSFFILSLLSVSTMYGSSLQLLFVDCDNIDSFDRYLGHLEENIQTGDRIVLFDSRTSEPMLPDYVVHNARERNRLKDDLLKEVMLNRDKYIEYRDQVLKKRVVIKQIGSYERDVARMMETTHDYIRVFKEDFDEIQVIFFGDSFIHNAYGHDFSSGIPSDGFIYLDQSEFNAFPDTPKGNHSFRVFYDYEPLNARGILRFYNKLIQKKFNVEILAFNPSTAMSSKPQITDEEVPFFPNEARVIAEKTEIDCGVPDKFVKNYSIENTVLNIVVTNPCRANSIISFQHDNNTYQVTVNANGRAEKSFHLFAGRNIIQYKSLKDDQWITVLDETIEPRPDMLTFRLDESTNTVLIEGYNPLRIDGDIVDIHYVNTGSLYKLEVTSGRFSQKIPVAPGRNIFHAKEIDGNTKEHIVEYSSMCSDKIEFDKSNLNDHAILPITLKNSCRKDGSKAIFIYDGNEYPAIIMSGLAKTSIIFNYEINEVFYVDFDKNIQKVGSFKIKDFKDLIRMTITYHDNVNILANIFEAGVKPPDPPLGLNYIDTSLYREGHLHKSNLSSTKGRFFVYETPSMENYLSKITKRTYQQIYVTRQSKQEKGFIYFFVDYFSRHGTVYYPDGKTVPPLCGKRVQFNNLDFFPLC